MSAKPRFDEIDLLRGIACLAVVAFHYLWRGQLGGWVGATAPAWVGQVASFGDLGVHLFFIISGFVIFMSAQGATVREFFASRAGRLFPALWVAAPLTAGLAWLSQDDHFQVDLRTLLINLSLVPQYFHVEFVDGAYWSLAVELQFYLLIALVIAMGKLHRMELLLSIWLLLSIANWLRPVFPLQFWLAVHWAPFFSAGILAFMVRKSGLSRDRGLLYLACWILAVLYTYKPSAAGAPHTPEQMQHALIAGLVVSGFFVLFALIAFGRLSLRASALTRWAGLLTYPVYLLHQNIGYMGIEALAQRGIGLLPAAAAMTVLAIAAALVINRLVERPLGGWMRRQLQGKALAPRHASV
jgi:peptidoglycan/LPS O-acetylase OafA/YrhL